MQTESPTNAPIRAIVARFSISISHQVMENVLQERPFEFCGIISVGTEPKYFAALPKENQEWFVSAQIRGCQYEGVDWDCLDPVDSDLIESMRDCEAIFMDAVARLEWKRSIPFALRKRWYLRHLRFWNDYLTRKRINLYLSAWIPHELPDIILYRLCKLRGIPVLYFHTSSMRDTSFAEHEWEQAAFRIGPRYEELLHEHANVTDPLQIPLSEKFDERYKKLTEETGQKPPVEGVRRPTELLKVKKLFGDNLLKFFWRGICYLTPRGIVRAWGVYKRSKVIRARNAFYDARAVEPDLEKPFVYLPLHFQPEASTLPMGGCFNDQLLIVQMLNACLPEGVLIYAKEHPRESAWVSRDVDYYKDFLELKKVRLIARHVDTFALREKCKAVATPTGTAGFEALFRGKPVFLFGNRFYQYARGIFRISSTEDCKNAVQAIFDEGAAPTLKESRIFLKAMEDTGISGILNPWHLKVTNLTDEQHIEANTKAILEEVKDLEGKIGSVS